MYLLFCDMLHISKGSQDLSMEKSFPLWPWLQMLEVSQVGYFSLPNDRDGEGGEIFPAEDYLDWASPQVPLPS